MGNRGAYLCVLLLAVTAARSEAVRQYIRIPAQQLEYALQELARQTNVDVLSPAELVRGRSSREINGYLTAREALTALLEGAGLQAVEHDDKSLTIVSGGTVTPPGQPRRTTETAPAVTPSAATWPPGKIEEIIVTANRRSEELQAISLAITAVTGPRLQAMGAESFQDYARTVPGVSFVDGGPSHAKIVVRGISTDVAYESSATTSLYFDDVPVTASAANPDLKMVDIERVEVLRGPQGTLYGEAAMGGTIRVVTARPQLASLEASGGGSFSATKSGGVNWNLNGVLNLPLIDDRFAARLVGYSYRNDGYIDNVPRGRDDINDETTTGGRVAARWRLSDDVLVDLSIIHQDLRVSGRNTFEPSAGDLRQLHVLAEPLEDVFTIYNLSAEIELGQLAMSSATSYQRRELRETQDYSAVMAEIVPLLGRPDLIDAPAMLQNFGQTAALVHETRVVSSDEARLRWLWGLYLTDRTDELPQRIVSLPGSGVTEILFDTLVGERKAEQVATFGELTYALTDKLAVTAGWRWFQIDQRARVAATGLYAGGFIDVAGEASSDGLIPKYVLSYEAAPGKLLYAQAAKGFRQGGATVGLETVPGNQIPSQYDPDSLWSYELGGKTLWLDGRLVLNAALFDIEWSDIQTTIDYFGNFLTGNAGNARSRGAELEIHALLLEQLELTFAGSWIDAELTTDQLAPNDGLAGQRMPGVPRESFSASARYALPVTARWHVYGQADYRHVGSSRNGFRTAFGTGEPADRQPAYDLVDLRLGWSNNRSYVELFANNVFDERAALFVDRTIDLRYHTNRPRTIGIAFRTRFDEPK